jgi:hypothetical protein
MLGKFSMVPARPQLTGHGPHHVISTGEIVVTLAMIAFAIVAFIFLAWNTRNVNGAYGRD